MKTCLAVSMLLTFVTAGLAHPPSSQPATKSASAFVMGNSQQPFTPWGFNYDHDSHNRLLEDYWQANWPAVESDFHEMKQLGANVVRIHLQFSRFMEAAGKPNQDELRRLTKLLHLAESTQLYLDITGLGCYRRQDVPAWYDALSESDRWKQQAIFWSAVAKTCAASPAVFVYDLMNEPVVPASKVPAWLDPHEFGGFSFVQYITKDPAGRKRDAIARQWTAQMVAAIHKQDPGRLVTIGMLPMLGTGFEPSEMAHQLSYLSVHVYPERGKLPEALKVLEQFQVGKPLLVEEIFPLRCDAPELADFMRDARPLVSGWIGFYWGKTPDELRHRTT